MDEYLQPTRFLDCDSAEVRQLVARSVGDDDEPRQRASRLFIAVRDGSRYDPYTVSFDAERYRASVVARAERAFCIPKAILLAAACRAAGIPARLGFADVRNHLSSERLAARMGTDIFAFHGYTEIYLDGHWLKATPAFNRELCDRFGVPPLEFDGTDHALLQPFDGQGRRHMEYVRDRGTFADFPFEEMVRVFCETYPQLTTTTTDMHGMARPGDDETFS